MEDDKLVFELCGSESQLKPPSNNPNALDLRGIKWEDDCIELDFGAIPKKSIKPRETKPVIAKKKKVIKVPDYIIVEEVEDPAAKALRQAREAVTNKILKQNGSQKAGASKPEADDQEFQLLQRLEDASGVISNTDPFDCPICYNFVEIKEGIILRDCLHSFCKDCLKDTISYSEDAMVKCPFSDNTYSCDSILQSREVRALVPEDGLEKHLARGLQIAEGVIGNTYHCKTADCIGFCEYEAGARLFQCPNCLKINCIVCDVMHGEIDCDVYQILVKKKDAEDLSEKAMEEALANGTIMRCPGCKVKLEKMLGCDYLVCFVCQMEICWVTKKARRGPDGCKCEIIKCHPQCGNCH